MKAIDKYKIIPVPKILIEHYKNINISDDLLLTIIKLLSLEMNQISISKLLIDNNLFNRDEIANLLASGIFPLKVKDGDQIIELNSIYERLESYLNKEQENHDLLTQVSDFFRDLYKRNLNLEDMKIFESLIEDGYDFDDISIAIKLAYTNKVDNPNYIEKITKQNGKKV